jgi:hypothetical protein
VVKGQQGSVWLVPASIGNTADLYRCSLGYRRCEGEDREGIKIQASVLLVDSAWKTSLLLLADSYFKQIFLELFRVHKINHTIRQLFYHQEICSFSRLLLKMFHDMDHIIFWSRTGALKRTHLFFNFRSLCTTRKSDAAILFFSLVVSL